MSSNLDQEMAKAVKLAQAGKLKPAIAILESVVAKAPSALVARYNLALFQLMAGQFKDAIGHLDRILAAQPHHQPSLFSKAKGLLALNRADEALPILERLAAGNDAESLLALGTALHQLGRDAQAIAVYERLTSAHPALPGGHVNLGLLLVGGDSEQALAAMDRALVHHPGLAELHGLRGQALLRLGRLDEAIAALDRALEINPGLGAARGHLLRACRESTLWDREEEQFARIEAQLSKPHDGKQLILATQDAIFYPFGGEEIRKLASAEAVFRVPAPPRPLVRPQPKAAGAPLVVGYLSPDFREHATMHLAGDLFGHHDRSKVLPIAYSVGPDDGSDWRARLDRDCHAFVDLAGTSDAQAAARIAQDGVNILVDMSVYTRHARPGIAAHRPAPIQMVWLGLAATSGAPWLDYAMVDPVLVPAHHRNHFSESLIRLPGSYQANMAWHPLAAPPSRADLGLPDTSLVFASFNGHRKLDRASFGLWLEILGRVPDSVLWQLAPPDVTRKRLEAVAQSAGIDAARLIWAPMVPRAQHLARIAAADLFIDALVCGAHTTAADCLRAGVPLVTVAGPRLASRVAASLLHAVGLPELVAETPAAMADLAATLADDPARLNDLRARLASLLPTCPAFDPARFARGLEAAYDAVWARHAAGKKPADIDL